MALTNSTDQTSIAFLAGGGEMGARMRAMDWSTNPLGVPEQWPVPLRTAIRILLTTQHPMFIFWGPEHRCFYNDAYARSLGPEKHPTMLGARGLDMWPETWSFIGPQIELVMNGEGATWHENHLLPITRFGRIDQVYWTYSYGPIDDASAPHGVGGVLVICNETTAQVLEEQRKSLLVTLDDRVRRSSQMEEIISVMIDALSPHLRASRLCFGLIGEADEHLQLKTYFTNGVAALDGRFPLRETGSRYLTQLQQGGTIVCNDVEFDSADASQTWRAVDTSSFITVPLFRDGRLRATLFVNDRLPRLWSAGEVRLVEQVAARLWDALERRRAESELRLVRQRFELALAGSPIVVFSQDLELRYTWIFNPPEGLEPESFIGKRDIESFESAEYGVITEALKREVIRTGNKLRHEVMVLRKGVNRYYDLLIDPILEADGSVTGVTCVAIDITEVKQTEHNRTLLIDELNHRVKNTLALVQSISRQTFKGREVPGNVKQLLEGRIAALATAHDILTRTKWVSPLLITVVEESLQFCGPARPRVHHSGPDVMLAPDQAIPIAMALHELCTNALKYGALSNDSGSVELNWQIQADGARLAILWLEQNGPPVAPPQHSGFGSMMIEKALSQQLDGTVNLRFPAAGVRCEIEIPLRIASTPT